MRTNRPASKLHIFPYFLDLVEDNVRNRCIFPLCALALYVLLTITIIVSETSNPQPPSQIKSRLPFQDTYTINRYFNESFPTPRILVTNQDGNLANQSIIMQVTDLLTAVDGDYPICDGYSRKDIAGSLEYIRLEQVCKIEIWNKSSVSDSQGQSTYNEIKFARAPQGTYYFNFYDSGNNAVSEEYTTFLQTTVIKMKVVSGDPPIHYTVGIPFNPQPQLLVLDQNGYPVEGKRIVAFSWPEPQFTGTMTPYLIEAGKFALLDGDVSDPSNSTGIASFKNLTIHGSNSNRVYIYFVCDGIITQFWGKQDPKFATLLNINLYYRYAINLNTNVSNMTFVQNYSKNVTEGNVFANPIAVQVLDSSGKPLENKLVVASLWMSNGDILPYKYSRQIDGKNKKIIKPIPGKYHTNYTNPFLEDHMFVPLYTNKSGIVIFTEMFFSVYGPAGKYRIELDCEGVSLLTDEIFVQSLVQTIKIIIQPSSYVTSDAGDIANQINCMIQVVDNNDNPIQGKTPNVTMLKSDGTPWKESDLNLIFDASNELYNPSDEFGYLRLYFKFSFASLILSNITMKIDIDGITTKSNSFLLEYKIGDNSICGSIIPSNFPSETYIGEVMNPPPVFTVYSTSGLPLAAAQVILDSTYSSDEVTQFPSNIYPDLRTQGSQSTDGAGIVTFKDYKISQGVYSHFYFKAITLTAVDPQYQNEISDVYELYQNATSEELDEMDNYLNDMIDAGFITKCVSPYVKILLKPKIAKIVLSNYQLTSSLFNQMTINLNSYQTVALTLYGPDNQLVTEYDVTVNYQTIQMPSYMTYTKFTPDPDHDPLTISDNKETDEGGMMNLKVFVGRGFPGKYAINFIVQGVYSDAMLFKTDFTFDQVIIASNFSSTYDSSVGNPVGVYLNQAFVKVTDSNGLSIPFVPIYAKITSSVNSSKAFIDYSEAGDDNDSSFVVSWHRLAYTEINGLANFKSLTLIEVLETTCVNFEFYVGESDNYKKSVPTQAFCFKSDATFETYSDLYSKVISMNNPFIQPLKAKVSNNKFPDLMNAGLSVLIAIPYQINGKPLMKPFEMAPLYMKNFVCVYNQLFATKASSKICSSYLDIQGNKPYFYIVEMKGLKWIQSAFSTSFYLSISDLFSYVRPNSTDSTQIYTPNGTKVTGKIDVSNTPDIIQISTQPTSLIYVGDIFEVSVICKVSSGSPIVRGTVKAAIVQISPSTTSKLNTSLYQTKSLIYSFSEGKVDIDSLGGFSQKSNNVRLDPTTNYAETNRKGVATFNLKVQTGLPGSYNIVFSASKVQSNPSTTFKLMNRISSVKFMQDIETAATIDLTTPSYYRFKTQPKLNISYLDNLIDVRNKTVEVLIYKALDQDTINQYYSQMNGSVNDTKTNMETLMSQKLSDPNNIATSFAAIGGSLFNAVVNGGKISRAVERVAENFPIKFDPPTQDSQGTLIFNNLEISFKTAGSYNLIISVNGIESMLSNKITISQPEMTVEDYVIQVLQKLLVILMCIFVIMANSAYHNHFIWIPLGYAGCIVLLILMDLIEQPMIWKALIYIITGFILVFLIEITYQVLKKVLKKKTGKNNTMTFTVREEMFYEYTYQMIFKKPSKNWLDKENYKNPYNILSEKIDKEPKIEPKFNAKEQKNIEMSPNPFEDSPNKIIKHEDMTEMYKESPELAKGKTIKVPVNVEFDKMIQNRYENLKFLPKIKRLLTPFSFGYRNDWVIADCFFYPQRFITSSLLGACSVAYFAYLFFSSLQAIFQQFADLGSKIHNSFLVFMGGALSSFKSSFAGTSFDEHQFQKGMNFVNFITDQFTLLARCLSIGFYVGSSISLLFFVITFIWTFHSFKRIALDMRKGEFFFQKAKLPIGNSTPFIGMQIAVSAVSFILVSSVFGIVFTVLVHPLLWQFLWENIIIILITIGFNLLSVIIKITILKCLLDPFLGVKHRRLFAIYEIISVYLEIVGGLLTALARIVTQMIFGLITLLRVDESILPLWIMTKVNLDAVNASFYCAIYMYHAHNNPIFITFANILMIIWENQIKNKKNESIPERESRLKKRRLANRFLVCYYMVKYPSIMKMRKRGGKNEEKEENKEMSPKSKELKSPEKVISPTSKEEKEKSPELLEMVELKK